MAPKRGFHCQIERLGVHFPLPLSFPSLNAVAERLAISSSAIFPPEVGLNRAAVALVLRQGDGLGPEVLLIERAEHPDDPWSGHMALPGGRAEPIDQTLYDTATREAFEEVQVDLKQHARCLGHLTTLTARARHRTQELTVTPYVFELTASHQLTGNGEVQQILWVPLPSLLAPEAKATISVDAPQGGERLTFSGWDVGGRVVWGLTHRMLSEFLRVVL